MAAAAAELYTYPVMDPAPPLPARRAHLTRLMQLWRSAGWPSRDAIEIDLLAAGWVAPADDGGRETLRLTPEGLRLLALARQRNLRAQGAHDRLAARVARQLAAEGRVAWRELALRAQVPAAPKPVWRIARPDVFSVRHTTVPDYLHPVVHEIKVSRADLLSDLRQEGKRQAYQWLCSECVYVFPAGLAEPDEIPDGLGVWVLHGEVDGGRIEPLRPARHVPCTLPFAVWMALARATPEAGSDAADLPLQRALGDEAGDDAGTPDGPDGPPPA